MNPEATSNNCGDERRSEGNRNHGDANSFALSNVEQQQNEELDSASEEASIISSGTNSSLSRKRKLQLHHHDASSSDSNIAFSNEDEHEITSDNNENDQRQQNHPQQQEHPIDGMISMKDNPNQRQQPSSSSSANTVTQSSVISTGNNNKQKQQQQQHANKASYNTNGVRENAGVLAPSLQERQQKQQQPYPLHQRQQQQQQQQQQRQQQQLQQQQKEQQQQQPEGWRVKLYRLNAADGSWDDCGTGRIVCLYRSKKANSSPTDSDSIANNGTNIDQWLYQETMEATLCVHAEVNTNTANANNSDLSQSSGKQQEASTAKQQQQATPQVLLRTRILLREAYQRQGDNIITWCEPYYTTNSQEHQQENSSTTSSTNSGGQDKIKNSNNHGSSGGVDLALSFQDNAGCLDIWRQITHVQGRAAALLRQQPQQQQQQQQQQYDTGSSNNGIGGGQPSVEDMAAQVAAQHHAHLQEEQEKNMMWTKQQQNNQHNHHQQNSDQLMMGSNDDSCISYGTGKSTHNNNNNCNSNGDNMNMMMGDGGGQLQIQSQQQQQQQQWQLPSTPTLQNLEEVGDVIASLQHVAIHRETLATWIVADDCLYLKELLRLFPSAEERGDYGKLATLAACVKTILLLNDASILDWIVSDGDIFEQVCACLEYDPDLREKANHRWFLRERARFRTVVLMEDPNLIELIHRSFRVHYLQNTLLRPTMDESSLSTLASLQTFTQADVIKGVTMSCGGINDNQQQHHNSNMNDDVTDTLQYSYLVRVIRMLAVEIHALTVTEWADMEANRLMTHNDNSFQQKDQQPDLVSTERTAAGTARIVSSYEDSKAISMNNEQTIGQENTGPVEDRNHSRIETDRSIIVHNKHEEADGNSSISNTWKQYLAPQDGSVESRRLRRRGCLSFLRELFNMVRISLQQCDKEDFFSVICTMKIDLMPSYQDPTGNEGVAGTNMDEYYREIPDNVSQTSQIVEVGSVASTVRSADYRFDINEKPSTYEPMNNPAGTETISTAAANADASLPPYATLLASLGNVLCDPSADASEKGFALEILSGVAMQDPSLIRRHCLDIHRAWKKDRLDARKSGCELPLTAGRPEPNEKKQVIFFCPPDDLLASLLFLLDVETDAGVLLQVSEIMRIILDTDMMAEHGGPLSPTAGCGGLFADDAADEGYPATGSNKNLQHQQHDHQNQQHNLHATQQHATEQKQFLSMFYEHYVEWLVVPFQCTLLHPTVRVPSNVLYTPSDSPLIQKYMASFQKGAIPYNDPLLKTVPNCAIRASFTVELLSFCVRAHLYRMKFFLLKSRVLGSILNLLRQPGHGQRAAPHVTVPVLPGDRCLKLAALRFLRSVLSVKDEFYHRHIIQHNLFEPVFETLRANPVGDNLVSSAIVEICDFIHTEKIKLLIEHIVTKHLLLSGEPNTAIPSLEDVSGPYVSTLTTLRKEYEKYLMDQNDNKQIKDGSTNRTLIKITTQSDNKDEGQPRFFSSNLDEVDLSNAAFGMDHHDQQPHSILVSHPPRELRGKALEDQRKFREIDEEESYFDSDDDNGNNALVATTETEDYNAKQPVVDGHMAQQNDAVVDNDVSSPTSENELHRTPRMFSLDFEPSPPTAT